VFKGRFSKRRKAQSQSEEGRPLTIGQGILYLHLIIILQVLLLLGLIVVIVVMGKALMTPTWIFILAFLLLILGIVYLYRKAKKQIYEFGETVKRLNLSGQSHEISIMGGMFTMRVENKSPKLPGPATKEDAGMEKTKKPTIQ
jgi:hypothetical protein